MVSFAEFQILLAETEARVNNKPLKYETDNINEPEAPTPPHLLSCRTLNVYPVNPQDDESLP